MLASVPLVIMQYGNESFIHSVFTYPWFLAGLAVVSSLLLVAPVRIMALKFKTFGWKENKWVYILLLLFILLLVGWGYLAVPLIYVFYILISLIDRRITNNKS
jgi:CDP-diacylglycerol--serine O-phosphatidyltransferase